MGSDAEERGEDFFPRGEAPWGACGGVLPPLHRLFECYVSLFVLSFLV